MLGSAVSANNMTVCGESRRGRLQTCARYKNVVGIECRYDEYADPGGCQRFEETLKDADQGEVQRATDAEAPKSTLGSDIVGNADVVTENGCLRRGGSDREQSIAVGPLRNGSTGSKPGNGE